MGSNKVLRIGYAGRLRGHRPEQQDSGLKKWLKEWFWEFRVKSVDPGTRSGYYLFQGIQLLKKQHPQLAAQIRLEFWGSIDPIHLDQAKSMGIEEVLQIEGYKSRKETLEKLQACDVLFLPLESGLGGKRPLFIPGKLYEYLEMGKPILALIGDSDVADILEQSRLGAPCDPKNPEQIAERLHHLIENKHNLQEEYRPDFEYIRSNFSFESLTGKLAGVFDEVLSQ